MRTVAFGLMFVAGVMICGCELLGMGDSSDGSNGSGGGGFDLAKSMADSHKAPAKHHLWDGIAAGQKASWETTVGTMTSTFTVGVVSVGDTTVLEYTVAPGDNPVWARVEVDKKGNTQKAWLFSPGNPGHEIGVMEPAKPVSGGATGESDWESKTTTKAETVDVGGTSVKTTLMHTTMKNKKDGSQTESKIWHAKTFPIHPNFFAMAEADKYSGLVKSEVTTAAAGTLTTVATAYGTDYKSQLGTMKKEGEGEGEG